MHNSTLCYVIRGDQVLMLHRVKKKNDVNKDKWIGIGGKFEAEESPDECLLRECREETGLRLTSWQCRGVVTFLQEGGEGEYMYLFTAEEFEGNLHDCPEGDLQWEICSGSAGNSCIACPCGKGTGFFWICCGGMPPFSC